MSSQLALFKSAIDTLANDVRGQITYRPDFVSSSEADSWFAELREVVDWKAQRRVMYDRELDVPRLTATYRLEGDEKPLPSCLRIAAERVSDALVVPFTSVGLNLYRCEKDSVAPHNDHLNELERGRPIALLSLGATRLMAIRAKQPPRRVVNIELEKGSLLVMSYDTQIHYTHAIPKMDEPVGERISLAFRVRPAVPALSARY